MYYSFYPVRAMDEDTARYIEGLEHLADKWGYDLTRDLKPTQAIDNKMKGANHDKRQTTYSVNDDRKYWNSYV